VPFEAIAYAFQVGWIDRELQRDAAMPVGSSVDFGEVVFAEFFVFGQRDDWVEAFASG